MLVHGIAVSDPHWAQGIIPGIEREVERALAALPGGPHPGSAADVVAIESVYWKDVVAPAQQQLFEILRASRPPVRWKGGIWNVLKRLLTGAARTAEQAFVTQAIADITSYLDGDTKRLIHQKVQDAIDRLAGRVGATSGKAPLTIVAHSLGTVISSDYVWDELARRRAKQQPGFHDRLVFANFFTVGSPLALFSLRHGGAEAFRKPIQVEHPDGRWLNIRDKDDPVGMPLKTLNADYGRAVHQDIEVDAGHYLAAHMAYFSRPAVLRLIGRKLALDWLAFNQKLPTAQLQSLLADYDRESGGQDT